VCSGFAGGAYGYVAMGPYQGGQAQFLRVPYADFNCLPLPAGKEHESDFILLADIFPTGVSKYPEHFVSLIPHFASFNAFLGCFGFTERFEIDIETREESGYFLIRQY
jgi:hypothetical protein